MAVPSSGVDPPDARVHGVGGVDPAGSVGGDAEDEPAGVGNLRDRVVVLDAIDLARLATDVDAAVGGDRDALWMIESLGERLDVVEADRADVDGFTCHPAERTVSHQPVSGG